MAASMRFTAIMDQIPLITSKCNWRVDEELKEIVEMNLNKGIIVDSTGVLMVCKDTVMYPFNYMAYEIWHILDGETCIRDIINILHSKYDADKTHIAGDVVTFLNNLYSKEIVEWR